MTTTGDETALTDEASDSINWLLARWNDGDREAAEAVLPLVYDQLRNIARRSFRGERRTHTLQPTALVHEAYIRLVEEQGLRWSDRSQFLGAAACLMRRVLVDHARSHNRIKRGGQALRVTLAEAAQISAASPPDIEELHQALSDLARIDPLKASVVEMRLFGGLSIEDTANCLGVAPITVSRHWRRAKAWIYHALTNESSSSRLDDRGQ